jgi:hypothetical protein
MTNRTVAKVGGIITALVIAAAGVSVVPSAASAHQAGGDRHRSCGSYSFVSHHDSKFHGTASTGKWSDAECAGHAWVRVMRWNGDLIDWRHYEEYASISITSGSGIEWSEHKTQRNEAPKRYSH